MKSLNNGLKRKRNRVKSLNNGLKRKRNRVKSLNNGLKRKRNRVKSLNNGLKRKRNRVKRLNNGLKRKRNRVKSLNNGLKRKRNRVKRETRENRSGTEGVRISVRDDTPVYHDFNRFLKNEQNKTELFCMFADKLTNMESSKTRQDKRGCLQHSYI